MSKRYVNPHEAFAAKWKFAVNGCHEWTGSRNRKGYGQMRVNKRGILAHRFSWVAAHGLIPNGLFVLHRCDNRSCVNIDHLFLGTAKDNTADMISKGRQRSANMKGEANPASKLTVAEVRNIFFDTRPQRKVAAEYGVSQIIISKIRRKLLWASATHDLAFHPSSNSF